MGYEATDFQSDVIEASKDGPVLVDFWAPWCGPCRQLGPVLESLAKEADGWRLVKVNTDQNPDPARQFGVRGIPAVKLFVDGTVEAEFTGALPEHAVRRWLEENLPNETTARLQKARTALEEGREEDAEDLLWPVLEEDVDHPEAQVLMAQALAFRDPTRAKALAASAEVTDPGLRQVAESVETLARLVALAEAPDELPQGEGREAYRAAIEALADEDFDTAVERFIASIQQNRSYDEDGARKACVALFTLLGPHHPTTQSHRRSFDMALY